MRCTRLTSVDLPAPEGPTSPTFWPAGMDSEKPSKTPRPRRRRRSRPRTRSPRPGRRTAWRRDGRERRAAARWRVRASSTTAGSCAMPTRARASSREPCRTRKVSGTHHHDLARGDGAARPEMDGPGQHRCRDRPQARYRGALRVFSICIQLRRVGARLDGDLVGETVALAPAGRERLYRPDVGHRVDTSPFTRLPCWASLRCRGRPRAPKSEQGDDEDRHEQPQGGGHAPVHHEEQDEGTDEVRAGWQDAPGESGQHGADAARGGSDPPAERASQMIGKITQRLARRGARTDPAGCRRRSRPLYGRSTGRRDARTRFPARSG